MLKGHGTLITDGRRQARNTTGNPGMATGGIGRRAHRADCGAGLPGPGRLRGRPAGRLFHGLAGDLAAAELGQVSMIAGDLVRFLPEA